MADIEAGKLQRVVEACYRKQQTHRDNRNRIVEKIAGSRYDTRKAKRLTPFNFLALAVSTFARSLYSRNPSVMINTAFQELRPLAHKLELSLSHMLRLIEFKEQMDMTVFNALTGMGIMKTGLMAVQSLPQDGVIQAYGQPYSLAVDFDDFVYDASAKTWNELTFCGDRQRVPLAWAKQNPAFNPEVADRLSPINHNRLNKDGSERIENLSRGQEMTFDDEMEDYTELWDIWLPKQGLLVTIPSEGGSSDKPLSVVRWDGPRHGPYHILGYNKIPNNIQPVAPAMHWEDIHDTLNSLLRKLNSQAAREKNFTIIRRGADRDGEKIARAVDGDIISADDPKNCVEMTLGGPNQPTLAYFHQLKDMGSWLAGNLDTLGGLSPQANTLGQEQLLAASSSKQVQEMQERTVGFTRRVITDLGYWLLRDTNMRFDLTLNIGSQQIPTTFTPQDRLQANYNDFNFEIDPFSMQDDNPASKIGQLKDFMGSFGPLMPVLQQQGKTINLAGLIQMWARYNHFVEIDKLITYANPQEQQQAQGEDQPLQEKQQPIADWPKKPREEIRRTVPGSTRQSKDALMAGAMSGSLQPKEQAALGRK